MNRIDNVAQVKEDFNQEDFTTYTNQVWIVAELLGVEESGYYDGVKKDIVLAKTSLNKNKPLYVWVIFDQADNMSEKIQEQSLVYIKGHMSTSIQFNEKAVSHTFIVPDEVVELEEDVFLDKKRAFSLNYTLKNRVVLEGKVDCTPWREFIPGANSYVTRFSVSYDVKGVQKSMYCTVWDKVNDMEEIEEGMTLRLMGSFNLLKKGRGLVVVNGRVVTAKKNNLDAYVLVVQQMSLKEER